MNILWPWYTFQEVLSLLLHDVSTQSFMNILWPCHISKAFQWAWKGSPNVMTCHKALSSKFLHTSLCGYIISHQTEKSHSVSSKKRDECATFQMQPLGVTIIRCIRGIPVLHVQYVVQHNLFSIMVTNIHVLLLYSIFFSFFPLKYWWV